MATELNINNVLNDLTGYIPARKSQINLYSETALYYLSGGNYVLYKPAGEELSHSRTQDFCYPALFISSDDRINAIKEMQSKFTKHLKNVVTSDKPKEIKDTLVSMVNETLKEPRAGVLGALSTTVDVVVESFGANRDVMKTLAFLSDSDYSTAMHAVNVMALTIAYCDFAKIDKQRSSDLALMALLHDIGKTEVPMEILKSTGKLSEEEFRIMQSHPQLGAAIISSDSALAKGLELGALEHHEKLDGSGYPNRITNVSFAGRLIGIIDCYEALTGDERPYRRAMPPLKTLELLRGDVNAGKMDREIFTTFCRSLV